ncbi:RsmE family RNA methyltransferase [Spiroplasma ixodetis]|uniref:RsmE family RNA methyltransferase n=1 Tax=Spiroplasma ixodetis TaxID=2141 RepID=UPI002576BF45|nr:RsmE family RNA methyltransferase [Spiroplasma ixodetis]WJG70811.1 16S ribosomal RNA methyltransferase RsmE [Spiroplasma ixodetis Y32]
MECYFTNHKTNNILILDEEDSKHLIKVLRHKINDEIVIIHQEQKYLTKIIEITSVIKCEIIKTVPNSNSELRCKITLVISLLKEQKFDLVIKKAVELGVYQIVPLQLKRCVSVLTRTKAEQKVLRWQNIAKAAAKQSNRNLIPIVTPVVFDLKQLERYRSHLNLVAYENSSETSWISQINNKLSSITIIVGPEGGITKEEIATLTQLNFSNISLGKLILCAETAPLFLMSIINYETSLKS